MVPPVPAHRLSGDSSGGASGLPCFHFLSLRFWISGEKWNGILPVPAQLAGDELERVASIQLGQVGAQATRHLLVPTLREQASSRTGFIIHNLTSAVCSLHNDLPFGSHITITVFIYAKQHLIKKKKKHITIGPTPH